MSIKIGKYTFEGPYSTTDLLEDMSGIYAIIDEGSDSSTLIDVGESSTLKSRVENHDRSDCWKSNSTGNVKVAALYTPNQHQSGRMLIEQELRNQYSPVCGLR